MSQENTEKQSGVFDEIAELGRKYGLTTTKTMEWCDQQGSGKRFSRGAIMEALIGSDYEQMEQGQRNMIFTTLIKPDLDAALEMGILKQVSEKDEYEKVGN